MRSSLGVQVAIRPALAERADGGSARSDTLRTTKPWRTAALSAAWRIVWMYGPCVWRDRRFRPAGRKRVVPRRELLLTP